MANKLPWFTHDHNARNDDFIYRSEDRFGAFGYSAYFKILELLHEHGTGDCLLITPSRLTLELRSSQAKVRLYLDWGQTWGKLKFDWSPTEVRLEIKKFRERQANRKSKTISTSLNGPSKTIQQEEEEREGEGEKAFNAAAQDQSLENKSIGVDASASQQLKAQVYREAFARSVSELAWKKSVRKSK